MEREVPVKAPLFLFFRVMCGRMKRCQTGASICHIQWFGTDIAIKDAAPRNQMAVLLVSFIE